MYQASMAQISFVPAKCALARNYSPNEPLIVQEKVSIVQAKSALQLCKKHSVTAYGCVGGEETCFVYVELGSFFEDEVAEARQYRQADHAKSSFS